MAVAASAADVVEDRPALIRRRWAAFAVALATVMSVLDGVMLNVALPNIGHSLGASPADAIWVVNAYQLAAVLVMLPIGKLADIVGHRRVYLTCMAVFTFASAGCALSQTLPQLSLCRFVQGCGGAGVVGITNAMLRHIYPPKLLARGIGINLMVVAVALASGPTIASLILDFVGWPWLFLVNVPIGVLLLGIGARTLPTTAGSGDKFDMFSALLTMATFGLVVFATDARAHSENLWLPAALAVGGIALGSWLIRHQLRLPAPLFPVDLLRSRMFGLSVGTMFAASMAQIMAYVALPFFFQTDLGLSQLATGLLFLPWPVAIACISPVAGRLGRHYQPGLLCGVGLGLFAAGLTSLALLGTGNGLWEIAGRMALCGLGYGLFQPPSSRAMITSAPIARAGSASVMGATGRVVGQAVGAAAVASVFRLLPDHGRVVALGIAAAVAVIAMVVSLARGVGTPGEA